MSASKSSRSVCLDDVKWIKQEIKDCVFGYVRNAQTELPVDNVYYTIPSLAIYWILLYFYESDEFDSNNCNSTYTLSDNNMVVTKNVDSTSSAYLTMVATNGVHLWKFKILQVNSEKYNVTIGVWKTNYKLTPAIGICSTGNRVKQYGWLVNYDGVKSTTFDTFEGITACNKGDIIEMMLDLNERNIKYSKNGGQFVTAFDNIQKTSYIAVVSAYKTGDSIQLLSYKYI